MGGSVHSDMNAAVNSLKDKVAVGDERISTLNASSSSSTGITNSNSVRVVSIRNEAYDNAGRKTEGYWVECQGGRKTRVYRTAWDSSKDWFSPNGLGTKNFIAKESISINDVAQSICR